MFEKLDFSDLYKFLTSVGLVLILSAFFIPWLFISNVSDYTLSSSEYNSLTEGAQDLYGNKVALLNLILKNVYCISIILLLLGAGLFSFGIINWSQRQKTFDQIDFLSLIKLKHETKSLTEIESRSKTIREIETQIAEVVQDETENIDRNIEKNELINSAEAIEDEIYNLVINIDSFNFDIEKNVKILNTWALDLFLTSINNKIHADRAIEIKYFKKNISLANIKNDFGRLKTFSSSYRVRLKRHLRIYVLVIYEDALVKDEVKGKFDFAIKELNNEGRGSKIETIAIPKSHLTKEIIEKSIFPN